MNIVKEEITLKKNVEVLKLEKEESKTLEKALEIIKGIAREEVKTINTLILYDYDYKVLKDIRLILEDMWLVSFIDKIYEIEEKVEEE